jgi:hypothetical protein
MNLLCQMNLLHQKKLLRLGVQVLAEALVPGYYCFYRRVGI